MEAFAAAMPRALSSHFRSAGNQPSSFAVGPINLPMLTAFSLMSKSLQTGKNRFSHLRIHKQVASNDAFSESSGVIMLSGKGGL